jgi:hypothetical protein
MMMVITTGMMKMIMTASPYLDPGPADRVVDGKSGVALYRVE